MIGKVCCDGNFAQFGNGNNETRPADSWANERLILVAVSMRLAAVTVTKTREALFVVGDLVVIRNDAGGRGRSFIDRDENIIAVMALAVGT